LRRRTTPPKVRYSRADCAVFFQRSGLDIQLSQGFVRLANHQIGEPQSTGRSIMLPLSGASRVPEVRSFGAPYFQRKLEFAVPLQCGEVHLSSARLMHPRRSLHRNPARREACLVHPAVLRALLGS